jgi:hypothetical protein
MAQTIITQIIPINQSTQTLTFEDDVLINNNIVDSSFNVEIDIIETFVYDLNLTLLSSINSSYTVQETNIDNNQVKEIYLDPVKDLENNLFNNGIYITNYNFQRNKLDSSIFNQYYIKEISTDRTELRIDNSSFTNTELKRAYDNFSIDFNTSPVFNGFYLNFNNNNLLLATNISYDESNERNSILIKLYEPLPNEFNIKSQFWVVEKISESLAYQIEFVPDIIDFDDNLFLRGPNLNIPIKDQINNSTEFKNLDTLFSSSFNLQNQLDSLLIENRAELNTDYTDYNNFVFFSSISQRLNNFYDKVKLIENYNNDINNLNILPNETNVSSSKAILETKINDIIKNFDGYDYYLYYESSSYAWPKSNSTKPYTLYSTGSTQVLNWFGSNTLTSPYYGGQFYSASKYDNENQNNLYNLFPQYLVEDDNNFNFQLFVEMTGQLFDEIWLYTQAIVNRNDNNNSLTEGISIDLVADALRSYGLNIYQSSFTDSDLYTTYLGITPGGSTLPPTGSELITTYITSSADTIPFNDANKLIYKRLYHNLPYLLKKKGTIEGLRLLLTCFGIPDTLLQIVEFGGKNKINTNDWDYFEDRFNYAFSTSGSSYITSSFSLNSVWGALSDVPQAVEFRFQTSGLPINYSQSLWQTDQGVKLTLKYTGSALSSGSYSASIADPYNQYGFLEFQPENSNPSVTASVYLPFYNNGWWSVLINRTSPTNYTLYTKNNIYDGYEGNKIGFQASSSISTIGLDSDWTNSIKSIFAPTSSASLLFSGSLQEIRYYTQPITENSFDNYVMNPLSIEQSEYLAFRATLGGELYTENISIHPKVTGSWTTTSSFASNSNFYISNTSSFITNVETIYYNEPLTGILNRVSNKIQLKNNNIPTKDYSDILSPLRPLSQTIEASESYSRDNNLLEVGLSPQNEIDKDITEQLGYFNIGEYIGDPRQTHNNSYSELKTLRDDYFLKYISSYDYNDYVRLIKYFDNALFKMIKDFVPARTSIATGIIIKPTILERSKYPEPTLSWTRPEYTGSIQHYTSSTGVSGSTIYNFSGDNGGIYNGLTSSFTESFVGPLGLIDITHDDNMEFYNGELEGSVLTVTTQSLLDNPYLEGFYKLSIGDLQNLNVNSTAFIVSASYFDGSIYITSGSVKFNILNPNISYYNTTTYQYKPSYNVQQDILITITGSIISGSQENGTIGITLEENGAVIGSTSYNTLTSNEEETFNISISLPNYYITSGSTYEVKYSLTNTFPVPGTSASINTNSKWTSTTTNLQAQSTYYLDPTVYTQQNFPGNLLEFSEYNAILNNVYSNTVSEKYFDVDYSQNLNQATNYQLIISQSALYAQVQDSNYTSKTGWYNARYGGSKNTGEYNYSQSFKSVIIPNYPIDNFVNYFIYYDWIGGSDPQYPGGGNVHGIYLISTEGVAVPLTQDNKNLFAIENIYAGGTQAYIYPAVYSSGKTGSYIVEIVDGGAIYESILVVTGSKSPEALLVTNQDNIIDINVYFTGSNNTLTDKDTSIYGYWIYSFSNPSSSIGFFDYITFNTNVGEDGLSIRSKSKNQFINAYTPPYLIEYEDTMFPLQYGDMIRFGTTGSYSVSNTASLDGTFTAGGLFQISSIITGSDPYQTGSIILNSLINNYPFTQNVIPNKNLQNFRIMRRIPNESYVLIKNKPSYLDPGFLIPFNFNPNYNPYDLAKKAGIIQ